MQQKEQRIMRAHYQQPGMTSYLKKFAKFAAVAAPQNNYF